ncbi:hypothetical protein P8452_05037 [Trifolium repens]|nr:hypothetical protein P8452_05037 [Trifolium repens]
MSMFSPPRIIEKHGVENKENLLSIAWKNWKAGTTSDIVDPLLDQGFNNEKMRSIHVGLLCVQEDIDMRPTMSSVFLMLLNSSSFPLPEPLEPPFLMQPKRALSLVSSDQFTGFTMSTDSVSGSQFTQGSINK